MPTLQFPVERDGPKRVEVTWSGNWNGFSVKFDGKDVGTWTTEELKGGTKEVVLADGSKFKPHLRRVGLGPELALLRDGVPLPESAADPVQLMKTASGILFLIAAYEGVLGVLGLLGVEYFRLRGFGVTELVVAGVVAACGAFTRQKSRMALAAGMTLYLADFAYALWLAAQVKGNPVATIIVHFLLLTALWRAFKAMGEPSAP